MVNFVCTFFFFFLSVSILLPLHPHIFYIRSSLVPISSLRARMGHTFTTNFFFLSSHWTPTRPISNNFLFLSIYFFISFICALTLWTFLRSRTAGEYIDSKLVYWPAVGRLTGSVRMGEIEGRRVRENEKSIGRKLKISIHPLYLHIFYPHYVHGVYMCIMYVIKGIRGWRTHRHTVIRIRNGWCMYMYGISWMGVPFISLLDWT